MRTTPLGAARVVVTSALCIPLSVLLLGGPAFAAGPGGNGNGQGQGRPAAAAPAHQDGSRATSEPASSRSQPAAQPVAKPPAKPVSKPVAKSAAKPAATPKSVASAAAKPGSRVAAKPAASPTAAPDAGGRRGTLTEPQLLSSADLTGTGANPGATCEHAYCSTRDGSLSLNGNGAGAAVGQPCAGCVGRADNKNPPGQASDGTDGNRGYECDDNAGIGRSNPAHTGCQATTRAGEPPTVLPMTLTRQPVLEPYNGPAVPGVRTAVASRTAVAPAALRSGTAVAPAAVLSAAAAAPTQARPTVLPFTGADVTSMLPLALTMLALGAALVRAGRRRTATG